MGRWVPGAEGRLLGAALDLYAERGFEQTTVAEIAERAGVTERTFFRYFADKREVLFAGSVELQSRMVAAIAAAPSDRSPLDAAVEGLAEAVSVIEWEHACRRYAVVTANTALQERELLKMASLRTAASVVLVDRGTSPLAAALAADSSVAVFTTAFEQWVATGPEPGLPETMPSVLAQLRGVVTG